MGQGHLQAGQGTLAAPVPPGVEEWRGGPVYGKVVTLRPEQGPGELIQFSRFAPVVAAAGASRVVLATRPELVRLLRTMPQPAGVAAGAVEVVPETAIDDTRCDLHAPLLRVPGLLGLELENLPPAAPYLAAEPDRVARWREAARLGPGPGLKVGIAWRGNPRSPIEPGRSFPVRELAPLAALPGVRLISLQRDHGLDQLGRLPARMVVEQLGDDFDTGPDAFLDMAAAIASLDLVVSADTAVAHLAGALGRPVWVVLRLGPDCRWAQDRTDSPWYPTMQLFRQDAPGDWAGAFAKVAHAARELLSARPPAQPVVPVSWGELLDKIAILEIKRARIAEPAKVRNVADELAALAAARDAQPSWRREATERLCAELKAVNEALWDVEDAIRERERLGDFGPRFVELARSVYRHNDRRAALKRSLNEALGSGLAEEKSYAPYG